MRLAGDTLTLAASTMRAVASASSLAAASNFLELSTSISASASDLMALTRSEVAWAKTRAWRTISPAGANERPVSHNRAPPAFFFSRHRLSNHDVLPRSFHLLHKCHFLSADPYEGVNNTCSRRYRACRPPGSGS